MQYMTLNLTMQLSRVSLIQELQVNTSYIVNNNIIYGMSRCIEVIFTNTHTVGSGAARMTSLSALAVLIAISTIIAY